MALIEAPHHRIAPFPKVKHANVYLIGDSISSGLDENPNWSAIFQRKYGSLIVNLAKPGATLSSALGQSELVSTSSCLVILEIGGNDLLGAVQAAEFGKDLELLLTRISKPSRTTVMFELPLLPGQAEIGRQQRLLTEQHGVFLIPKRYFCQVLSAQNATIDGLHLSPIGSSLMADLVHRLIGDLMIPPNRPGR